MDKMLLQDLLIFFADIIKEDENMLLSLASAVAQNDMDKFFTELLTLLNHVYFGKQDDQFRAWSALQSALISLQRAVLAAEA